MLRKPKVNDLVAGFCYAARSQLNVIEFVVLGSEGHIADWPHVGFDEREFSRWLAPFAFYAMRHHLSYILAQRLVILFAGYCRKLSAEERVYAYEIMEKYYGLARAY